MRKQTWCNFILCYSGHVSLHFLLLFCFLWSLSVRKYKTLASTATPLPPPPRYMWHVARTRNVLPLSSRNRNSSLTTNIGSMSLNSWDPYKKKTKKHTHKKKHISRTAFTSDVREVINREQGRITWKSCSAGGWKTSSLLPIAATVRE